MLQRWNPGTLALVIAQFVILASSAAAQSYGPPDPFRRPRAPKATKTTAPRPPQDGVKGLPPFFQGLSLTPEQKESIAKLHKEHRQKEVKLLKRGRVDPDRVEEQVDLNEAFIGVCWELLTPEQKRTWLKKAREQLQVPLDDWKGIEFSEEQLFTLAQISAAYSPGFDLLEADTERTAPTNQDDLAVVLPNAEDKRPRLLQRAMDEMWLVLTKEQRHQADVLEWGRFCKKIDLDADKFQLREDIIIHVMPIMKEYASKVTPLTNRMNNARALYKKDKDLLRRYEILGLASAQSDVRRQMRQLEAVAEELMANISEVSANYSGKLDAYLSNEQKEQLSATLPSFR